MHKVGISSQRISGLYNRNETVHMISVLEAAGSPGDLLFLLQHAFPHPYKWSEAAHSCFSSAKILFSWRQLLCTEKPEELYPLPWATLMVGTHRLTWDRKAQPPFLRCVIYAPGPSKSGPTLLGSFSFPSPFLYSLVGLSWGNSC